MQKALVALTLITCLFLGAGLDAQPWTQEKANAWLAEQPWIAGFNYVPSYAVNSLEQWQEESFDLEVIERELTWGAEIGYRGVRVFLPYTVWKADRDGLFKRFDQFAGICDKLELKIVPVILDDCAFGEPAVLESKVGPQREPIPGMILSSWVPSPGNNVPLNPEGVKEIQRYLEDWLNRYADSKSILFWDLFNEPLHSAKVGSPEMLQAIFWKAWQSRPSQPLTVGVWSDNVKLNSIIYTHSDILSFHTYGDTSQIKRMIELMQAQNRPVVCSEWMARPLKSDFEKDLPLFKVKKVMCFQWGLVNGRTQAQFPWWNKPGQKEGIDKAGWFHDVLHTDGTAYRESEITFLKAFLAK
ncbi:hypothetical protein [Rubellicoccus peritrichatus]|uniref:Cellulase (Glycosyl hydrolase family 5) n=1 Tax=Rubellicoccus peritrichatus TaxID=3080537 RepID=A0AAQ3L6V8_9BACT|nr:hypothetical protein [Puniceicoccus sp. CR14]WOO40151.1 hypothetical protein RZN69_16135 [Puniceicoccus sp. CR14]